MFSKTLQLAHGGGIICCWLLLKIGLTEFKLRKGILINPSDSKLGELVPIY